MIVFTLFGDSITKIFELWFVMDYPFIISSNTLIILILKTIKQVISFIYICIYKDMLFLVKEKILLTKSANLFKHLYLTLIW
ncbi:DNA topoisomerase 1 [Mycoplasmoides gallisepticum NC08_2008.031-4-3P]|nr:DNA topoisomerase 1 [Mycoplasmoides gallisepticum NC08_2008.031-4-3P]